MHWCEDICKMILKERKRQMFQDRIRAFEGIYSQIPQIEAFHAARRVSLDFPERNAGYLLIYECSEIEVIVDEEVEIWEHDKRFTIESFEIEEGYYGESFCDTDELWRAQWDLSSESDEATDSEDLFDSDGDVDIDSDAFGLV